MHERAGTQATESDLIDVEALVRAYYEKKPDASVPEQRVVFGTSGHRGSSLNTSFNEHHILATTQAIVEYRASRGITGPLFIGADTHALSAPAQTTALDVLVGNQVRVLADEFDDYVPTPALSHAILKWNNDPETRGEGEADGIVITPSHNPPQDGGFKYNPPHGGPADSEATAWIANRANELIAGGLSEVNQAEPSGVETYDFRGNYVDDLANIIDFDAIKAQRHPHRRRPPRRGIRALLGRDPRPLRPRPHRRERAGRPDLVVHDARLGRQDPHGPVEPLGDGVGARARGRVRHPHRQ